MINLLYKIKNSRIIGLALLLIFLIEPSVASADRPQAGVGVKFRAQSEVKERRTSIETTEFDVDGYLKLSFDWNFYNASFGYIARIIFDNGLNVDVLTIPDVALLTVVARDETIYDSGNLTKKGWRNFEIVIKPQVDSIYVNGVGVRFDTKIKSSSRAKIYFGAVEQGYYATYDVSDIEISNISVMNSPNRELWHWDLGRHCDNLCVDSVSGEVLSVENGEWIIDRHFRWKHEYMERFSKESKIVSDRESGIYVVSNNSVWRINLGTYNIDSKMLREPIDVALNVNQFIYDDVRNRLCFFDVDRQGDCVFSVFDEESGVWRPNIELKNEGTYGRSNLFVSPIDSTLHQMLGYGFHRYKSDSFVYRESDDHLEQSDLSAQIPPRYLSAMGQLDEDVYLYGGYGHPSGKQKMGPHIYSDAYRYNLRSGEVRAYDFSQSDVARDFVATNLIFPTDDRRALALVYSPYKYESALQLVEIDFETEQIRVLADSLEYNFNDLNSKSELIYRADEGKLYAYTSHLTDACEIEMSVYSLLYPAINSSDSLAVISTPSKCRYYIVVTILVVLGAFLMLYYIRRRRVALVHLASKSSKVVVAAQSVEPVFPTVERQKADKPGIYLLGGFMVINRAGEDITGQFSPMMRQLLSLIILATQENGKGILSVKLKDYLWYDKSDDSARNNRGVIIRKIRVLLDSVGDYVISSQNNCWHIEYLNGAYCNYVEAMSLLSSISSDEVLDDAKLRELISVAKMGGVVPNQQIEFFDSYKSKYTDKVIALLKSQIPLYTNSGKILQLAESILLFDSIDEYATLVQCQVLINRGQLGIAKSVFERFVADYEMLLGVEFSETFEQFVAGEAVE